MGKIELTGKDKSDFIPEITPMRNGLLIVHNDYYNQGRKNPVFITNDQLATIYEKMKEAAIKKYGGARAELLAIIEKNIGKTIKIYEDAPWTMCKQEVTKIETHKYRMLDVYNELEGCITNSYDACVSVVEETETEIEVLIEY